jgi:uncharacterized protein YerC
MNLTTHVPARGHIPNAVVAEVLEDLKTGKTYRQIVEDYAVSLGWISKLKRGQIRKTNDQKAAA